LSKEKGMPFFDTVYNPAIRPSSTIFVSLIDNSQLSSTPRLKRVVWSAAESRIYAVCWGPLSVLWGCTASVSISWCVYVAVILMWVSICVMQSECFDGMLFNHLLTIWKFSAGLTNMPNTCLLNFFVSFIFVLIGVWSLMSCLTNAACLLHWTTAFTADQTQHIKTVKVVLQHSDASVQAGV